MGYVYISKIYFDFLKRIIPHISLAFIRVSALELVSNSWKSVTGWI